MLPRRILLAFISLISLTSLSVIRVIPVIRDSDTLHAAGGAYVVADTWPAGGSGLPADAWPAASGVAIDKAKRIYVADAVTARISVIEAGGTVRLLAPPGVDPGLVEPHDLAVDDGRQRLYVADPGAGSVVALGLDGARQAAWGPVPGLLGVGVAPDGTVYAGSATSGDVHSFAPDGSSKGIWRAMRPDGVTADLIRGLDVAADGTIAVLDGRSPRLGLFDARGQRDETILLEEEANDVAADYSLGVFTRRWFWFTTDSGLLFHEPQRVQWNARGFGHLTKVAVLGGFGVVAIEPGGGRAPSRVHRFPHGLPALTEPPLQSWGGPIDPVGVLDGPDALQVGADGFVYVLDRVPRVQWFTPAGVSRGQVASGGVVAVDSGADGTVYASDGTHLAAYAPGGARRWRLPAGAAGATSVVAVAYDRAAGHVVVLDGSTGTLRGYTPSGTLARAVAVPADPDGRPVWTDLAVDGRGTAYVLDRYAADVVRIEAGGGATRFTVAPGARRLAVRGDGVVLVLGRDGWVRGYDGTGARVLAFDARRPDLAAASSAADLAVDAVGDVYVADRAADVVTRYRWDPDGAAADPPEGQGRCDSGADKRAAPDAVDLGDTVEVTLEIHGSCTGQVATVPLDIVLIIDRSGSMLGERIQLAREAAGDFVAGADLAVSRIGLVSFNENATIDADLTSDEALLRRALAGLVARGGTRIDQGLAAANTVIGRGGRRDAAAVFILLSDGGSDPISALREAERAKQAGAEIFTINVQGDVALLTAIASDRDHYYAVQSARALGAIFDRIGDHIVASALFRRLEVVDRIPANMRFVPGSDVPQATYDDATGTLRWVIDGVPMGGLRLRYRLEPLAVGEWPTNVEAWADFVDGYGRTGRLDFPVPRVRVAGLAPTPTASATATIAATPSRVPPATPTATPTRRLTATRTPRRPLDALYLPLALRERCVPAERRADVMLVIDTSNSMAGAGLEASRSAAERFVRVLNLPSDQAGVVTFNTQATLASRLTGNRAAAESAIRQITATQPGTRIDRGLDRARLELLGPRARPANQPVIVLLTDGEQEEDPDSARRAADLARRARVRIYAIGLGPRLDPAFLRDVTGEPSQVYLAPTPSDLAAIYAQVAGEIPCPRAAFWGGR